MPPTLAQLTVQLCKQLTNSTAELSMERTRDRDHVRLLQQDIADCLARIDAEGTAVLDEAAAEIPAEERERFCRLLNEAGRLNLEFHNLLRYVSSPAAFAADLARLKREFVALRQTECGCYDTPDVPLPQGLRPQAIVVVDLVRYTGLVRELSGLSNVFGDREVLRHVRELNQRVQARIEQAIAHSGTDIPVYSHTLQSTGDGAVIRFDRVSQAVRFARRLQFPAPDGGPRPADPFTFRVGIAFGWVWMRFPMSGPRQVTELAGVPLIAATRMEASSPPGGIAVELSAWQALQEELRGDESDRERLTNGFHGPETFNPKHDEEYEGWVHGDLPPRRGRGRRR